MATKARAKITGALVGAAVVAASFGGAADARIPEDDWEGAPTVRAAAVAVPDAVERAIARQSKLRVSTAKASVAPDWLERAALRAMRG